MHISSQFSKKFAVNNIVYVHIIDNIFIVNNVLNICFLMLLCEKKIVQIHALLTKHFITNIVANTLVINNPYH